MAQVSFLAEARIEASPLLPVQFPVAPAARALDEIGAGMGTAKHQFAVGACAGGTLIGIAGLRRGTARRKPRALRGNGR